MANMIDTVAPRLTAIERAFDKLGRFFTAMQAGNAAARDLDTYNTMSDVELARHGLSRSNVTRAIVERHFG